MAQPVGLTPGARDLGAVGRNLLLACAPRLPELFDFPRRALEAAEGIEQPAVGRHVDQRALVVLAVNLDQRGAQRLQGLRAHRLIIDEGAGAAVAELHAAENQLVLGGNVVGGDQRAHGMAVGQLERGRHLPLLGAVTHQRHVAARAERKGEGVEQDRLARAGLAGEHRQAGREIDVEPVDQDDVAYREPGQHAGFPDCAASYADSLRERIIGNAGGGSKPGRRPDRVGAN